MDELTLYAFNTDYWTKLCGMTLYEQTDKSVLLGYGEGQCKLELKAVDATIDRGTAYGRVAFSCPRDQVSGLDCSFTNQALCFEPGSYFLQMH